MGGLEDVFEGGGCVFHVGYKGVELLEGELHVDAFVDATSVEGHAELEERFSHLLELG